MSKKLLKNIVKIANILDTNLLHLEADRLTKIAEKLVESQNDDFSMDDSYYEERDLNEPDSELLKKFENSEEFITYQSEVQSDPNYLNEDQLKNLENMLFEVFKDTDMQGYENEVLKTLVERKFSSQSKKFTAFEEAYEDVAWNVHQFSEKDDISRTPPLS